MAEQGDLSWLNSLDISRNKLSVTVLASLAGLNLSYLNLSDNQLEGGLPGVLAISAYGESFQATPACVPATAPLPPPLLTGNPLKHLRTHARHISPRRDGHHAGRSWHVDFHEEAEAMAGGKVFAKKMSWNMKSFVMLAFSERSGRDLIGNTGPGTSRPLYIVLTNGYKKLDSTELDGT
jgi:hypothetical protein